jgi:hypothetical protein
MKKKIKKQKKIKIELLMIVLSGKFQRKIQKKKNKIYCSI